MKSFLLITVLFFLSLTTIKAQNAPFVTTWKTTSPSEQITIPTASGLTYTYAVQWGDGTPVTIEYGNATHTYSSPGIYTVKITGDFPKIDFNDQGDKNKIQTVKQWGDIEWESLQNAFKGCAALRVLANDSPNLNNVTSMQHAFDGCINLTLGLSNWATGNVENMSYMFQNTTLFNDDISDWDVSSATTLKGMFKNAAAFDQNLGLWDIGNVTNMEEMFSGAGLSVENYDSTLTGWSTDNSGTPGDGNDDIPFGLSFDGGNSHYCSSTSQHQDLRNNHGWSIIDGGYRCPKNYVYDNGNWSPHDPSGVSTLDDNMKVKSGTVSLTANTTIGMLTINNNATLKIGYVLSINKDLTNNGHLIFTSNANRDGELGIVPLGVDVIGNNNITVQRYMSDNRAFRFVGVPITTTTSIHANWQEGATSNTHDPHPGFGTHITGTTIDQKNGFDATGTGNPSLYSFDAPNQSLNLVNNTKPTKLNAGEGYLLFVRGDRNVDLTNNNAHSSTILRTTGNLLTGKYTSTNTNPNQNSFNLIANPYQCTIDLNKVILNSSNLDGNYAYVYDPTLGQHGAFATVDLSSGTNNSGSDANQYLQPGQAVQVETGNESLSTVIKFSEWDKAPGYHTTTFNNGNPFEDNVHINGHLFTAENHASGGPLHDAFSILFNPDFDNELNQSDAKKAFNFSENMGIGSLDAPYSIEKRQLPEEGEDIALFNTDYQHQDYTLVLNVSAFENTTAYLRDSYTDDETELEAGENVYSFSVDQEVPGSVATNRFAIHFGPSTLSVENQKADYGITLFPNPASSGDAFKLTAGQFKNKDTEISINNMLGKTIYRTTKQFEQDAMTIKPSSALASGVYLVKIAQGNQTAVKRLIVK